MDHIPSPAENLTLVFRYVGGPKDGVEVRGDQPSANLEHNVEILWIATKGGQIGASLHCSGDSTGKQVWSKGLDAVKGGGSMRHLYVLEGREEYPRELVLTFYYSGKH